MPSVAKSPSRAEQIIGLIDQMRPVVESAVKEAQRAMPKLTAATSAATLVRVRQVMDRVDYIMQPLRDLHEQLRIEIVPQRFEAEDVTTINLESGYRITISEKLSVTIPAENKDAAYDWLRKNKMKDLIIQTVNSQTLTAAARKRMEDGLDVPETIFKVSTASITSVTKLQK